MVYSYAVRSTNGILTAVTLADGVFLVVLAMEVELQVVDDFACLFGQSVFLYQRHHSQLHRSQGSGKFQYYARFTILQLLFTIGSRHDAEEHAVYTNRGLDDVRGIAFVGFRVEILDVLAGELLMLGQVEIRTAVDAFHFLEAEGHQELDVRSRIGVVSQLVVVVETVVIRPETERPMPFHTRIAPFGPPPHLLARADEELHLHLFELTHAEDELPRHDLVAERLADLGNAERQLHAAGLLHVQEINEDTLRRFGPQVNRIGAFGRRSHLGRG